ncbi:MAG: hypothetical protein WBE34_00835 [Candidatus Nitrosopolaris sp.]
MSLLAVACLLLLTNSAYLPLSALAVASSKVGGGVIQETVNTSNSGLDTPINKFYSCISKVTHEPVEPLKVQLDNCYLQVFGAGGSSVDNINVETHLPTANSSKISNTAPGT